jgi:hypothetical protein
MKARIKGNGKSDEKKEKAEEVDCFHHKMDNNNMSVVEKDGVVAGMLDDELARCDEALAGIRKMLSGLPKGSLSVRKKLHGDRKYEYHYLKFREGDKVVNQHVAESELYELQDKLALRRRYEQEAKAYEKRIAYLKKLLKTKGRNGIQEHK